MIYYQADLSLNIWNCQIFYLHLHNKFSTTMLTKKDKKKRYNKKFPKTGAHTFEGFFNKMSTQTQEAFKGDNLGGAIGGIAGAATGAIGTGIDAAKLQGVEEAQAEIDKQKAFQSEAMDNDSLLAEMAGATNIKSNYTQKDFLQSGGDFAKGLASGVLQGAASGAAAGPWGAVAGAGAALLSGTIGRLTARSKAKTEAVEKNQAAKEANQAKAQTLTAKAGALDQAADARSLAAYYAEGGQLNPFPSSQFGSPITEFNTGGSHEENPYDGIPQGIAPDGLPNLVEEGEVKFDNYIFSDRLMLNKNDKKKYKFLKGKTYADAAKAIKKQLGVDERPNDLITKTDLEEQLNLLSMLQEEERAKRGLKGENRMMYKNGGYMFNTGGTANTQVSNEEKKYKKHVMPEHGMYTYEMDNPWIHVDPISQPAKVAMPFNVLITRKDDPTFVSFAPYTTEEDMEKYEQAGYTVSHNFVGSRFWQPKYGDNSFVQSPTWTAKDGTKIDPIRKGYFTDLYLESGLLPVVRDADGEYVYGKYGKLSQSLFGASTPKSAEQALQILEALRKSPRDSGRKPTSWEYEDLTYDELEDPSMLHLHRDLISPRQHKAMKQLTDSTLATTISKEDLNLSNPPTPTLSPKSSSGSSFLQAVPVLGSAIGTIASLFDKPTYEHTERLTQPEKPVTPITYTPTHQDIRLDRFDTNYHANKLAAQAGATRRAIREQTGSNPYASTAALLSADANAQSQMGDLYRKAAEYNQGLALQEAAFNSQGRRADAEGLLKAASANASLQDKALSRQAEKDAMVARLKMGEDQAYDVAVSANLTSLFDNIGTIGKENRTEILATIHNLLKVGQVDAAQALGRQVYGDEFSLTKIPTAPTTKGAYGGKLKRKKGYTI